jgi:hypothetical protein
MGLPEKNGAKWGWMQTLFREELYIVIAVFTFVKRLFLFVLKQNKLPAF